MIRGPIAFRTLMESYAERHEAAYKGFIETELETLALRLSDRAGDAVERAYVEGLHDGFRQGVQAESERANPKGGTT